MLAAHINGVRFGIFLRVQGDHEYLEGGRMGKKEEWPQASCTRPRVRHFHSLTAAAWQHEGYK